MLPSNDLLQNIVKLSEQLLSYTHCSKDYERVLSDYGLKDAFGLDIKMNHMEIHVLAAIQEQPGIAAQELAGKFFRTKSAISQIIKRLVDVGLVIKQENPKNARSNNLYVTEIGHVACKNHAEHERSIFEKILPDLEGFSQRDFEIVFRAISVMRECMKSGE